MPISLKGRSLLTLRDFAPDEIGLMVDTAADLKAAKRSGVFPRRLENRNIAMIFEKPSMRTRSSFAVAAADEGANLEVLPPEDIRFGQKESIKDISRVLGRLFDGIVWRGYSHDIVRELAEQSGVPVWNALCDTYHPTQVLADLLTIREVFGHIRGAKLCYVGDGRNNLARSLMIGAAKVGVDLRILAPGQLQPPEALVKDLMSEASVGANILVTDQADRALDGCQAVYGDVWVSMGEEDLIAERVALLADFKVTPELMASTGRADSIYMHCLPALHDLSTEFARKHPDLCEVSDEVFEHPQSRVFDQAENRMHTAKAVMVLTVG
ncbi:MAG: ornithine carbamoyltransferase [Deltaproteobacteria bacterium]|jgi:ornithine carbamoyltransferase|nr:ornithine carbamoyltransferase [Deltaproteobacteria bacterium]